MKDGRFRDPRNSVEQREYEDWLKLMHRNKVGDDSNDMDREMEMRYYGKSGRDGKNHSKMIEMELRRRSEIRREMEKETKTG